ncbi:MAG: BamA/TamA family outer membrane protein [candidate division Zixibacteria bacterium]|nr:BamA/TamA family outer membrane protein [candidate division Zixibacteria bacterium]
MKLIRTFTVAAALLFLFAVGSAQETYFGKNKVHYKKFDWHYIQTEHFDIYYYQSGYDLAKFAAASLESAYVYVRKSLNYDIRKRVPVILFLSHNDFQQTNVTPELIEEGVGGFTESFKNRVVLPFMGNYEDFRHVLHHELTHAVIFDMLFANPFGSILSRQAFFRIPLWFAEGYAEYSSRFGMDPFADMVLRDATINNYLQPLDYVGGFLAYKEGQSALAYLAQKYGEEKISEIISKGKVNLSMDRAMKAAIGQSMSQFNDEWVKAQKKIYWPELNLRKEPREFAKQLTNHEKDGSNFNERPSFSPTGNEIAIFTDRSDFTEVYLISAADGKRIKKILKGERSGDMESLHSYVSGLSWSPDGTRIALVTKSKGEDALTIFKVKGGVERRYKFGMDGLYSPSYSPDGSKIVLVGMKAGQTNLYEVDLKTGKLSQVTNDAFGDYDPTYSPDGKSIIFVSDRAVENGHPYNHHSFKYGYYNLFKWEAEGGSITPLTKDGANNRSPVFSPDGKRLAFTANPSGVDNIYVMDIDSLKSYPVTNVLTGCFNPSWSKDGDRLAFACFYKGGFDIFVLKDPKPVTKPGEELPPTHFVKTRREAAPFYVLDEEEKDSVAAFEKAKKETEKENKKTAVSDTTKTGQPEKTETAEAKDDPFRSFVFTAEPETEKKDSAKAKVKDLAAPADSLTDSTLVARREQDSISATAKLPDGEYKQKKYSPKFAPDVVAGGLSYDTFFGLRGQSFLYVTDVMGDHQFFLATDLLNSIDQSNFQLFYNYSKKRIDYGFGLLYYKNFYIDNRSAAGFSDRLFSDKVYGVLSQAAYPFSKFTRAQLSLSALNFDREYFDPPYDDASRQLVVGNLSLVSDVVLWGIVGPTNGHRYVLSAEYAPKAANKGISYSAYEGDFRKYWKFWKRYNFVFRLTGGLSNGPTPKLFFVGGATNQITSTVDQQLAYTPEGFYASSVITPLRGIDYYELAGNRYFLTNLEFRFPFVDELRTRFPLAMILSRIEGVMFFDAGAAWYKGQPFQAFSGTDDPTTQEFEGSRLKDLKSGFGFGARANLGLFVLRWDMAWKTDFDKTSSPRHYFSFGADF